MSRYARDTEVSQERSRAEIEATIKRYGVSSFMYGMKADQAIIGFEAQRRHIRMVLTLPAVQAFAKDGRGAPRSAKSQANAHDKACRQRWRALALVVKAKLEAVESEVSTFEQEFMPYMVLPGGRTVAEEILPKLQAAYDSGKVGPLLLGTGLEGA
jgi:hypothetical protein